MVYKRVPLNEVVVVDNIITFHYYELSGSYFTKGERHDFWEFVYVDKGEVFIKTESRSLTAKQGEIIFYKPNQFHGGSSNEKSPPNLIILTFDCSSEAMKVFENKKFRVTDQERGLLSLLVKEGYNALTPPLDKPFKRVMHKKKKAPFGSEQLIKIYLEALLIAFIRRLKEEENLPKLASTTNENIENDLVQQIIEYMKKNIELNLTLKDICQMFMAGRSLLLRTFKQKTGSGVIEYFNDLKIEKAKALIREEKFNYSKIAEMLGYSSIHYFSRHFKRSTNMTPTEYARSVRARVSNHEKKPKNPSK
ncbi:helix-turn-helix domain-containing protein [Paenibacillus sp. MBLB4367]|uniref:helix-turn-helix domain-containing protein n=1 Tax=Paenibacillus sp. MBLB4367 TaxID=3384767 RepID=UPI0039084156